MKKNEKSKWIILLAILIPPIIFTGYRADNSGIKVLTRGNIYYLSNTVIIKTRTASSRTLQKAQNLLSEFNKVYSVYNFMSVKQVFKNDIKPGKFGLNRIMAVSYNAGEDPFIVAKQLKKLNNVEWAEPRYLRHTFKVSYQPNDPMTNLQYYLAQDKIYDAWNVTKGDTSVVIGVVDTGVDWPHPDLYGNIWHNWKDISTGWSADTDGIKYDSIGWDFGGLGNADGSPTPDSNPIEDVPEHGTLVAGIASAVTNNGTGIAGIGFRSKIMAVKVAQKNITDPTNGQQLIAYGFEGIKYAADNGAKVINCSWGGGGYSNAEQEVINYAISKGALVVVAAGNNDTDKLEYPAAYGGVLAVGAVDNHDVKAGYSNYGRYISVCAPGNQIYSTYQPGIYASAEGTSLAAPEVSGLAALVVAKFPSYTPLQIAQQIRINCDNIDSLNPGYKYRLGNGRINAYRALTNTNSEAVRAVDITATDSVQGGNGNGIFERGETISLKIKFTNYLKAANNLNISLHSMNAYSTIESGNYTQGSAGTLASFDNSASLFKIRLSQNVPPDSKLLFRLDYSDGSYNDFQTFEVYVNPSYQTQSNESVALTVASKGNLGFNDYPANTEGKGFIYGSGNNMLFEGALMFGTSDTEIEDAARGSDQNYQDTSFSIVEPFSMSENDSGVVHGITQFNDNNAGKSKLGISVDLNTYSYKDPANNNFIILQYTFTNTTNIDISRFYAGIFLDWDLIDGSNDNAAYDKTNNFGYVYHNGFNTIVASALISSDNYGYWAILNDGSDSGFSIYDGFTPAEKWTALSNGLDKTSAGPGDVSEVTSSGPYDIKPEKSINVAFAVAASTNMNGLISAIAGARKKYVRIINDTTTGSNKPFTFNLFQNYPNPFNPVTKIRYSIPNVGTHGNASVRLEVYDILGRKIATLVDEKQQPENYEVTFNGSRFASGIYFYRLQADGFTKVKKMVLLK